MKYLLLTAVLFACLTAFAQDTTETTSDILVETPVTTIAPLQFTYQPFIINSIMMVALNDLTDNIAITKTQDRSLLTLGYNDKQVTIKLNSAQAQIANETVELPFRTFTIIDDLSKPKKSVTFLPLRFTLQALNIPIEIVNDQLYIDNKLWEFGNRKILVTDLAKQRVYAFEGRKQANCLRICSGKPSTPTPTGIFEVFRKWPGWHAWTATKEVPYDGKMYNAIYFRGGAAFHGVDAPNMRSRPSSHGCCRMFCKDSDWLYAWTPGTPGRNFYIPKEERITVYVF